MLHACSPASYHLQSSPYPIIASCPCNAGFSFDWDREFSTTDPQYYKWTQWIFLQLFNKGLAYQAEVPVNWCPALGTVLANEEVIDGRSERGDHPVERLPMKQVLATCQAVSSALVRALMMGPGRAYERR